VGTPIEQLKVSAYTVPTDCPESDGTYAWDSTTLVLVEVTAGDVQGLGYTYADTATAQPIKDTLADVVLGCNAMAVPGAWAAMVTAIRNLGRPGITSMAIAAVDAALWDVKARLLGIPLVILPGAVRDSIPIYDIGGFTPYTLEQLQEPCGGWVADGITRVKMKVRRHPDADLGRSSGRGRPGSTGGAHRPWLWAVLHTRERAWRGLCCH
jgi:L-alanine-DL-glutamate epimerase-like enolase superfamily enzyme